MERKQNLLRVACRVEECCSARMNTIQIWIDSMLKKAVQFVSSIDHKCSKAIQK